MRLSGLASVVGRRVLVMVALGASLSVSSMAWAQAQGAPAGGDAAAAPAAQADPFKFSTDSGLMIYSIQPEKVADFEAMWSALRAKMAASDKPDLKALGDSLRIYKVATPPGAGQGQTYFFIADPASKTLSYQLIPYLLYNSGLFTRAEADTYWNKLTAQAFMQLSAVGVNKLP
jgi:hypothetical protein